jgi:hypothetical protein
MEELSGELLEQEKLLKEMVEKNRLLLEALEMDEAELDKALSDQSQYTPEEWAALQRHREQLEKAVDRRIQAAKTVKKPTQAKPSEIQGHWIFVR